MKNQLIIFLIALSSFTLSADSDNKSCQVLGYTMKSLEINSRVERLVSLMKATSIHPESSQIKVSHNYYKRSNSEYSTRITTISIPELKGLDALRRISGLVEKSIRDTEPLYRDIVAIREKSTTEPISLKEFNDRTIDNMMCAVNFCFLTTAGFFVGTMGGALATLVSGNKELFPAGMIAGPSLGIAISAYVSSKIRKTRETNAPHYEELEKTKEFLKQYAATEIKYRDEDAHFIVVSYSPLP